MSITDELREYAHDCCARIDDDIHAIADRIDAEHESKVSYWQGASYKDGYDEGFASADDWLAQHEGAMAEHGWVRLPKDADGEYIHIGDEVETTNFGTVEVEGFVHRAVAFYNYSEQPAYLCTTPANLCRHHHAPTVEDVLREFANEVYADADNEIRDRDSLCAKYAKRLTLAEGEDA